MTYISEESSSDETYPTFQYTVEFDNEEVAGFTEISGLRVENTVTEYQEGGVNDRVYKFPEQRRYSNVLLHRGLTSYNDFLKWITASATEPLNEIKKDVLISLNDRQQNEVWIWKCHNAFPVRWEGPTLSSDGSGIAIELVELAIEDLELV